MTGRLVHRAPATAYFTGARRARGTTFYALVMFSAACQKFGRDVVEAFTNARKGATS